MKKILLASILKPINDTRVYEKFAYSLSSDFEVHIMGYQADAPKNAPSNIYFHPCFSTPKSRKKGNQVLIDLVNSLKPDLLIIHTVELLPAAIWCRLKFRGLFLIYDVMENYAQNFWYQRLYGFTKRLLLSLTSRALEWFSLPFTHHLILAEASYTKELAFLRFRPYTVLENKCVPLIEPRIRGVAYQLPAQQWSLLYTGTISEVYGIKDAIHWCEALAQHQDIYLTVAGYTAKAELVSWLQAKAAKHSWLTLIGIDELVPHPTILELINQADAVLLPYQNNRSTAYCIPTKLYECLTYGTPMILPNNPLWIDIAQEHQAAIIGDFQSTPSKAWVQQSKNKFFYLKGAAQEALWQKEGVKLKQLVNNLLEG